MYVEDASAPGGAMARESNPGRHPRRHPPLLSVYTADELEELWHRGQALGSMDLVAPAPYKTWHAFEQANWRKR